VSEGRKGKGRKGKERKREVSIVEEEQCLDELDSPRKVETYDSRRVFHPPGTIPALLTRASIPFATKGFFSSSAPKACRSESGLDSRNRERRDMDAP
jgi:hypothetical protein